MSGKSEVRLVKIDELTFDSSLYPRMKMSWLTAYQYAQAMRAGAVFPPITVGLLEGKRYVLDGWHRIEAKRLLGEKYISAVLKKFNSKGEMFAEAVRLNSTHGRPLTIQEKVRIIDQLKLYGFKREEISQIVGIPVDKISVLEARIIRRIDGTPIYVKGIVERAAEKSGVSPVEVNQDKFIGRDVVTILEQLIEMIESGVFPFKDERAMELAVKLYSLLGEKLAEAGPGTVA
jgi:hypothetical protein